jgi:hypothetical protein
LSQQREKFITKKDNERQRNDIDINETKFFLSQEKNIEKIKFYKVN